MHILRVWYGLNENKIVKNDRTIEYPHPMCPRSILQAPLLVACSGKISAQERNKKFELKYFTTDTNFLSKKRFLFVSTLISFLIKLWIFNLFFLLDKRLMKHEKKKNPVIWCNFDNYDRCYNLLNNIPLK
jgi:hypothetical protein